MGFDPTITLIGQTLRQASFDFTDATDVGSQGARNFTALSERVEKWTQSERKEVLSKLHETRDYMAAKAADPTIPDRCYSGIAMKLVSVDTRSLPARRVSMGEARENLTAILQLCRKNFPDYNN